MHIHCARDKCSCVIKCLALPLVSAARLLALVPCTWTAAPRQAQTAARRLLVSSRCQARMERQIFGEDNRSIASRVRIAEPTMLNSCFAAATGFTGCERVYASVHYCVVCVAFQALFVVYQERSTRTQKTRASMCSLVCIHGLIPSLKFLLTFSKT